MRGRKHDVFVDITTRSLTWKLAQRVKCSLSECPFICIDALMEIAAHRARFCVSNGIWKKGEQRDNEKYDTTKEEVVYFLV